ncbi:hypothetical protein PMKS-002385 [Pichia membranifaciens]|uniref:Uncharacterized protein n=1 Tax=Pichia membranifaciens TaxID=4926 RepID=A0A1Q2YH83_9ASCO|nr:hypothetical protein PMKS-002385 [Pichia membranifaciens]
MLLSKEMPVCWRMATAPAPTARRLPAAAPPPASAHVQRSASVPAIANAAPVLTTRPNVSVQHPPAPARVTAPAHTARVPLATAALPRDASVKLPDDGQAS